MSIKQFADENITKNIVRFGAVVGLAVCCLAGAGYAVLSGLVNFINPWATPQRKIGISAYIKRGRYECIEALVTGRILHAARNCAAESGTLRPLIQRIAVQKATGRYFL